MCSYIDTRVQDDDKPEAVDAQANLATATFVCDNTHKPIHDKRRPWCAVCYLEYRWVVDRKEEFGIGLKSGVARCSKCGVAAHSTVQVDSTRQIHQVDSFQGLSCFEIMHTELGQQLWRASGGNNGSTQLLRTHPIVRKICSFYGLPTIGTRKNTGAGVTDTTIDNGDIELQSADEEEV